MLSSARSFLDWFCLRGAGYNFWSGIGSDVFLLTPVIYLIRHHVCTEQGCWRLGHPDPGKGHQPACRVHHSSNAA